MVIPEHEAKELLSNYGIQVVPTEKIESIMNLEASAEYFGFPVVLKLSSSRYSHKTEVGGVVLGLEDYEELEKAYVKLDNLRERLDPDASIIIEPMIEASLEFFIGIQRYKSFGLIVSFGLGGIFLELVQDVSFRLLPATPLDFREMVEELKSWPKLKKGFRGFPPVRIERVVRLMKQIGDFANQEVGIEEMDLNPVAYVNGDLLIVDARIVKN